MNEKPRPLTEKTAPDTARVYERAKPEKEGGMGWLDNDVATPTMSPDSIDKTIGNKQNPENQLNAEDVVDATAKNAIEGEGAKKKSAK